MNKKKLKKMECEFPFLESFLEKNFGAFLRDKTTSLDIKVQRMDANMLFYFGDHADGHSNKFFVKKHYGSLFTCMFFINENCETIFSRWGILHRQALLNILGLYRFRQRTKVVVIAEIETWYETKRDEKGHIIEDVFCHFSHRKINMTIYKEPEQGIIGLLDDPDKIQKIHLTNRQLTNMMWKTKPYYDEIDTHLHEMKEKFKPFFEKHLQAPMYSQRAFNCEVEGIKFLALSMAGRLLITLDIPTAQISYMVLDQKTGDSRMGVNSIDGTLKEANNITEKFIASCEKLFNEGKTFPDIFKTGEVGFAGYTFGEKAEKSA